LSTSDSTKDDFDAIDEDGDGFVTASELLRASVKENSKITNDQILQIVMMADQDGDNKVSYEEYAKFVR
jgi:Ca2+-binding EF-hand superfamily protein